MSLYRIHNATIHPYYEILINYLLEQRKEITSVNLRIAINLNIILACACQIEGVLESKTNSIVEFFKEIYGKVDIPVFEVRKPINIFVNSLSDDLKQRISQCMGIDRYDDFFKLLLKKSFKQDDIISEQIESIQVLFQLRNVIAHGRAINASEKITNYELQIGDEFFFGGYKKAEELLLKKGIIKNKFTEAQSEGIFFTDEVADYFKDITVTFIDSLDGFTEKCFQDIQADTFTKALVDDFNKKYGTNLTTSNFFENVKVNITDSKTDE